MQFGKLNFEPAPNWPGVLVAQIDPSLSDTAAFCARYGVGLEQSANCVIVEAKRADRVWYAACVVLATTRADINGVVRKHLEARKISFAPIDKAVALTGMEFGGITPIGLPSGLPILIDVRVTKADYVIIGSGVRQSKFLVKPAILTALPNAETLDIVNVQPQNA